MYYDSSSVMCGIDGWALFLCCCLHLGRAGAGKLLSCALMIYVAGVSCHVMLWMICAGGRTFCGPFFFLLFFCSMAHVPVATAYLGRIGVRKIESWSPIYVLFGCCCWAATAIGFEVQYADGPSRVCGWLLTGGRVVSVPELS